MWIYTFSLFLLCGCRTKMKFLISMYRFKFTTKIFVNTWTSSAYDLWKMLLSVVHPTFSAFQRGVLLRVASKCCNLHSQQYIHQILHRGLSTCRFFQRTCSCILWRNLAALDRAVFIDIFQCFENSWGRNMKGLPVLLCHFVAIISNNCIFGIGRSTFGFTHRGERKPAVSLTRAACLSAERSGQLDFDSALWVLGACVCDYFPRWILFKVFPGLPRQFCAAQNLQPWGGRDLEARQRDWSQRRAFFFFPPGRF